jgi:hypothetical protein
VARERSNAAGVEVHQVEASALADEREEAAVGTDIGRSTSAGEAAHRLQAAGVADDGHVIVPARGDEARAAVDVPPKSGSGRGPRVVRDQERQRVGTAELAFGLCVPAHHVAAEAGRRHELADVRRQHARVG